ncbi:prephenate dehydrogenase/arogenate dehydrogenase family protein [Pyrococcus sp. ST04]|uniref:prephenate dehydrogenase/arogenate dehydrogenase family protein n=1 Tax=Pyrococcus sp. ST04 TaxID=1183377 RepID=UPI0002605E6E|nr:prephenate dehydrogenase/arogenate dehydrogenase family protein [Pyrococcus sp. ST04]AFK23183.1 Prephenate dehydrogenase (pdh) [Pyrococcus sp. ST04]
MRIAISGYGKMGKLFGKILKKKHDVKFYSSHVSLDFSSLKDAYEWADLMILATSIEKIKAQILELKEISSEVPKDIVIFDIASFKREIVPLYSGFPEEVKVASVHPMFGPGVNSFHGEKFLIVPVPGREMDGDVVKTIISEDFGGEVVVVDAETHDRMMGFVIGVPYAIGLAYLKLTHEFDLDKFGGTSHKLLKTYGLFVLNDSEEFIRHILGMSGSNVKYFCSLLNRIIAGDISFFNIEEDSRDIIEAYQKIYEIIKGEKKN